MSDRLTIDQLIAENFQFSGKKMRNGELRVRLAYKDSSASITYLPADAEAGWQEALTYAATARLPLILVIASVETLRAANLKSLTWPALSKLAKKLRLPVLTVDGADAVAVYRVMQESAHRARLGDGAAVIWCALPAKNSAARDPLRNMKTYLAARNLLPRSASKKNRR